MSSSACFGSTPSSDQPQTWPDSILIRSSGRPSALPTSRSAPFGAVADHGRAQRGMVAAIGVEHPLHHDLAPLVLEIDVDVGRLAALLGDEALEQKIVAVGIDRGDAEHVADGAVGGRAAALAQDVLRLRAKRTIEFTVRKYGRIVQLLDQLAARARALRRPCPGTPSG